jgi:hypothetical protein
VKKSYGPVHVSLSVAFFSLGTRHPPGLPQGAKRTQRFALRGFLLLRASTPGFAAAEFFPLRLCSFRLASVWGFAHWACSPVALPPPSGLALTGLETPGFHHFMSDCSSYVCMVFYGMYLFLLYVFCCNCVV